MRVCNYVLHHHDGNPSRHSSSQKRKSKEQYNSGFPGYLRAAVGEGIRCQTRFLNAIDDEHAESGEDEGEPVDEGDVNVRSVHGAGRPYGSIKKDIESEGELEEESQW
jgi:hypothetical protein